MRQLVRFKWGMRGQGIRKKSCYIEPIEIAGSLTAKHCGDCTADCSNGVLVYNQPCKVLKPYGSTGGIGGVKLKVNVKDIASPITARDYKGILRNNGDAIVEVRDAHNVAIIDDQGRANKKLTPSDICPTLRAQSHGNEPKVIDAIYNNREPRVSDTCPTLRSERTGLLVKEGTPLAYDEQNNTLRTDGTVGTLTTDGSSPKHNNRVIVGESNVRIRRLTPREVWRLQGFPDEYFDKAAAVISDTQLYKAAGNAVSVPVAKAIGLKLREIEDEETENEFSY